MQTKKEANYMHRKSIGHFKRTRVKLEVFFYIASFSLLDFHFIRYETTDFCLSTVSGERSDGELQRRGASKCSARSLLCKAVTHIKDADVPSCTFCIVNVRRSYRPTGKSSENKTSGYDY